MFVSYDGKSYIRGGVEAKVSRNGSFISIHFVREGILERILIPFDDAVKFQELVKHGDSIETVVEVDQAVNIKTLLEEFSGRLGWYNNNVRG